MKKSEMQVSMPMTSYEELLSWKERYNGLVGNIMLCFNFDFAETENRIDFDVNKALELCREYLPFKFKNVNVIKTE